MNDSQEKQKENAETETLSNKKRRGLAFYLKILFTFIFLIFISFSIALYYVYYNLTSDDKFEQILMTRISEAIKMDVRFEHLDISFPGFAINSAEIATDSAELKLDAKIEQIDITPDFWAAMKGKLVLDSFALSSATAFIENRKIPVADKTEVGDKTVPKFDFSEIDFPFNELRLTNILINYKDAENDETLKISEASLAKSLLSSALPFKFAGKSTSYGRLQLNGNLYWPDTLNATLNLDEINTKKVIELIPEEYQSYCSKIDKLQVHADFVYRISKNNLSLSNAMISAEPGLGLSGKAEFSSLSPLNASISLALKPLEAQTIMSLAGDLIPDDLGLKVTRGNISGEGEIVLAESELKSFSISIVPESVLASLKLLTEPVTVKRGRLGFDGTNFSLNGFEMSLAGSVFKFDQGKVALSPFSLMGKIDADLNIDKTWKLVENFIPEEGKRVTPGGKAHFAGDIDYSAKGFKVDGVLNSSAVKVQEMQTKAVASLENVKVAFKDLRQTSGNIVIESLSLKGAGGSVALNGKLNNAKDPGFDIHADGTIELSDFSAVAAEIFKLPVKPGQFSGKIGLKIALGGTLSDLKPSGIIELEKVKADLADQGLLIENLSGRADADLDNLKIDGLKAKLFSGELNISGSLKDFRKPEVDFQGSLSDADLESIKNFIALNYPDFPAELKFSGRGDLKVQLAGDIAEPEVNGSANLKSGEFFHPAVFRKVESINGPVEFDNNGLTAKKVTGKWGESSFTVEGRLKDWGKLITDFSYSVKPLNAGDAAGFFLAETGYSITGTGEGSGKIVGPLEKIEVTGKAQIPSGEFVAPISEETKEVFRFPFQKLETAFKYFNQVFEIESATTDIFTGKISANGKIYLDKDPIEFAFKTKLDKIETNEFLRTNTKAAGAVRGPFDGNADIKGNTTGLNSIEGNASLVMKEGRYQSPAVVKKIADQLKAPQLASGPIENLNGDYQISGGRISSKNTMATSEYGKMNYIGSIGLDASLDGTMNLDIVRKVCLQSPVLKQLIGKDEYLSIPVSLKGNLMSPSVGLPLDRMLKKSVEKRVRDEVEAKAKDALGKIFGGKKKTETTSETKAGDADSSEKSSQQNQQDEKKKIQNKIKDVGKNLKKIFKF
jgi:hypothetical protein